MACRSHTRSRSLRLTVSLALCCALSAATVPAPPARAARPAMPAHVKSPTVTRAKPTQRVPAPWRDGQLLVSFRAGASTAEREAVARGARADVTPLRGASGLVLFTYTAGASPPSLAATLSSHPAVEYAEPNYLITADQSAAPDDPRLREQWALGGGDNSGDEAGIGINAPRAWARTTGSVQTVVALVDSGVDFSHPDLRANEWANTTSGQGEGYAGDSHGWDFVTDSSVIKDESDHGTAVAGLVAAEGNNGAGTSGVMWRASLMSLRVLDSSDTGDVARAVEAIDYAASHGAQIINCSWGTDYDSRALRDAVARAASRDALVVASAGNDGRNIDGSPRYPAAYDLANVLSVSALDRFSQLTSSSNWGASHALLAAPGVDLLTTAPGGVYREMSGTSAAAALASGVAGLIKTLQPRLKAALVREAVARGVRRASSLDGKVATGGTLDAVGALDALDALPPDVSKHGGDKGQGGEKQSGDKSGQSQDSSANAVNVPGAAQPGADSSSHPQPVRGRPSPNLPDLDTARRQHPAPPHAPSPIPSTLRNCPPYNPRCDATASQTPAPATAPTPVAGLHRAMHRAAQTVFVAAASRDDTWRPAVVTEVSLFDYLTGHAATDAPPLLLALPHLFAATLQGGNSAQFLSQSVPAQMTAGQTYNVSVTIKNTGTTTWSSVASYRLGAQNPQDLSVWRLGRVDLPAPVSPQGTVTFPFAVTAPATAGTYNFQWQMVQDGVEWFGDYTANVSVTVTAPQFDGYFEAATCNALSGWAWDATRPTTPIEVDVFADGNFLTRTVADLFRADLVVAGKGDGRHGFSVPVPASLRDGNSHAITARFANELFLAGGSPTVTGSGTVTGCAAPATLTSPSNLSITQATSSQISLSWGAPTGSVNHYELERRSSITSPYVLLATPTAPPYTDPSVASSTAYLYRVRAVASDGSYSPYSNVALGTAFTFPEGLAASSTQIKAQHFYELRQSVGAVRALAGQPAAAWTDSNLSGVTIRGVHLQELRDNLNQALSVLGLRQIFFTDPSLGVGATLVRKVHVDELRGGATSASGRGSGAASSSGGSAAAAARLLPRNRTGGAGGVDLLSGNFNWELPLLSLPGRAGLDLSLALSYNSLVWTRDDATSTITFNADNGFPGVGFRLGFPTLQPQFYDFQAQAYAYLMVMPDGSRVEFRQVGTSGVYEAADSSYLRLEQIGAGFLLRTPGGGQMLYGSVDTSGELRCIQIKDRNGNYISVGYDGLGEMTGITDTLGRGVSVTYDDNHNPLSITQQWGAQTHTWATFGYGAVTVSPGFTGVTIQGPNGRAVNVLMQVGLADGSRYQFDYNQYGQVSKIARYSADNHQLAYTAYDYATSSGDCPRVSAEREWALDWNNEAEVTTSYAYAGDFSSGTMTAPDGTQYKELFATSGWLAGLTTGTEFWAAGVKQKWTSTGWTQDDENLLYRLNPRVKESNVYDKELNRRRTRIEYYPTSSFSLPMDVYEYASDGSTILRRTHTDYNLDAAYTGQRLVGLVSARYVYGGGANASGETLFAKTTYAYDETTEGRLAATPSAPTHHDSSYGTTFTARGNMTSATRWNVGVVDADDPASVTSKTGYDTDGSAVFQIDALGHRAEVAYSDSFSDNTTRNTFAYPTAATDPDQAAQPSPQRSLATYEFATGALTRVQGVSPNLSQYPTGPVQTITYDEIGRVQRETNQTSGAYRRYVYSLGQTWVESFTTIKDATTESYSIQIMDGTGKVYASASDFPGSSGHYRAQHAVFDQMGRVVKSSNPTEVDSAWNPAGDDSAGWLYSTQDYDWKGRPTYSTGADGAMTQELTYGGCGCAGGEVVTARDSVGHKTRTTADSLGRAYKVEALNADGTTTYSTTTNLYNALDQVTRTRTYQGAAPSPEPTEEGSTYQTGTMTYDGHGRLASSKAPDQLTATLYTYYNDDTAKSVTDARGASATYTYNDNRHLVTGISYSAPAGITPTSNVSFSYDAAGNRTSMTDGFGTKSYTYNQLSRLTSESRPFGSLGPFTLSYQYSLGGDVTKITDATNMSINYGFDSTGQLTSVTGSDNLFMGISTYASNFQYRAWGGLKAMTDGGNFTTALLYNAKLQPTHFEISGGSVSQDYDYYGDGRLRFVHNIRDAKFDRSYSYDQVGRMVEAKTGGQARGDSVGSPYYETFGYDVFSNLTERQSDNWNQDALFDGATYTNNRRDGWGYDTDGRNTTIGTRTYTYDADGQLALMTGQRWAINHYVNVSQALGYDGDGNKVQEVLSGQTTYYLRSSVLDDAVVEEIDGSGQKSVGYVYSNSGVLLARQVAAGPSSYMAWKHSTPMGTGQYDYNVGGGFGTGAQQRVEFDPLGADVGLEAPNPPDTNGGEGEIGSNHIGGILDARWSNFFDLSGGCTARGVAASCSSVSPDGYMEAQVQAFFGDRWYDLVGNDNESERQEALYAKWVSKVFADYWAAQAEKKKPKAKPTLKRADKTKRGEPGKKRGSSSAGSDEETPRQTSFLLGAVPFNTEQSNILVQSYARINQDDCAKFINQTLIDNKVDESVNSLEKLLNKVRLSFYDTDRDNLTNEPYSPNELGLSADAFLDVKGSFLDGASAVTVFDVEHGNSITTFLSSKVFDRPGGLAPYGIGDRYADTSGSIVHELFHAAGIAASIVDSQKMTDAIQAHCKLPGATKTILNH